MNVQPDTNASESNSRLWEKVINGDRASFALLYKNLFQDLYRYGMTVHPNREVIGDAIHELFLDLWKYRRSLADIKQLKYYFLRSLRSKIYKLLKEVKRNQVSEEEYANADIRYILSPEDQLINTNEKSDSQKRVTTLINDLPTLQREAIMLIFFEGKSYEEASLILSKSIQSVYTLVSRGLGKLRKRSR